MDTKIINGKIIDGTGNPGYVSDIAIKDGIITNIGKLNDDPAKEIIDAAGNVVCPGFIDIHSHSDLAIINNPKHEPKIMQGVTTEAFSNCGLGFAPVTDESLRILRDRTGTFFGETDNLEGSWHSVEDYFGVIQKNGTAINIAYLVPHMALRVSVMGMQERPAKPDEVDRMCDLLRESLETGAFGMSSGLYYAPMCSSAKEESVALAKVVAEYDGLYAVHIRNYMESIEEAFSEVVSIASEAGVRLQVSHLATAGEENHGRSKEFLSWIDNARNNGLDIMCDSYPYLAGSTFLSAMLPDWAKAGSPEDILQRLEDEERRTKIVQELAESHFNWSNAFVCSVKTNTNKKYEGRSFAEVAEDLNKTLAETICHLLVSEELEVGFLIHLGNDEDVSNIMAHPAQVIISDGIHMKGKMHPRLYGTFPRYLGRYVREKGVITWENAIRKICSLPAQRLKLRDRGTLRIGMAADIVVFNPQTIIDCATYEEPTHFPIGIEYVIVNGITVKSEDEHTGQLAGRILRKTKE
jgi:N-acyl-D-amino-acid deacylase